MTRSYKDKIEAVDQKKVKKAIKLVNNNKYSVRVAAASCFLSTNTLIHFLKKSDSDKGHNKHSESHSHIENTENTSATMVMFVCGRCGSCLKKNQVDKHINQCRGCSYVSCMDCLKEFSDDSYADHLKCITENQKYGGTNYVEKEFKGEKKQEAWIANVQEAIKTRDVNPGLRRILNSILSYSNVPRKKKKFENFLTSSFNVRNPNIINEVWEIFDGSNKKAANSNAGNKENVRKAEDTNDSITTNTSENVVESPEPTREEKKSKKRKLSSTDDCENSSEKKHNGNMNGENDENKDTGSVFKWKVAIKNTLKAAPEKRMKKKHLRKIVFTNFFDTCGKDALTEPEMHEIFKQKLSYSKFVVDKDHVKLK